MRFELRRQIFHIFLGLAIIFLYYVGLINAFILFLIIIAIALGSYISTKADIPVISWFLDKFERSDYRKRFPAFGMLTFFIGSFFAVSLFPKNVALASIIVLTLGDSISILVGKKFGKLKHPLSKDKLLEGTLAGILFAFFGAMLFVNPFEALIASFFGMFIEVIDFKYFNINDNILIPLAAGFAIFIFRCII
jgi:dolichol kinase